MADGIGMNVSSSELEDLSRRLKAQGDGHAQRHYQRAIVSAVQPIKSELRSAARSARVTSSRGGRIQPEQGSRSRRSQGSLRARVAGAIDHRPTRKGARIYVDAPQVDPKYGASLPRYLDGELQQWRRWRHPIFGNTESWAQQTGSPWFFRTIRRHAPDFERALGRAMDDIAREVQG